MRGRTRREPLGAHHRPTRSVPTAPPKRRVRRYSRAHDPITPGEILLTEFLEPLGISQYRLAQVTGLPQTRISQIVRGKRAITTDTAPRLSKALGVDDRFWINIQTDYDLEVERDLHADVLAKVTALVAI